MSERWKWFWGGVGLALLLVVLALLFVAYQRPEMLLDWANIRYCG